MSTNAIALQAAYLTGDKAEMIRLAILVSAEPVPPLVPAPRTGEWRRVALAMPVDGPDWEQAILRRDERPENNHLFA